MNYKEAMKSQSKRLRVGYFCSSNPLNQKSWSGTHYSLYKSIENEGHEMINLAPIELGRYYGFLVKYYHKIHRLFSKRALNDEFALLNSIFSRFYLIHTLKKNDYKVDVIFAPAATASVALLPKNIPVVYFNDTTYNQLKDYYKYLLSGSKWSIGEGNYVQKLALRKSSKIIFPTEWAKDYAIDYYKVPAEKITVTRLGANIEIPEQILERDFSKEITFLFLGVNWERKGGDIVLSTLQLLEQAGYQVKLIVCGCKPPVPSPLVQYEGFLDKNNEKDRLKLKTFLNESHFLFVPTRAECYGIVFSEASAYGLISITTHTGGVPSIIKEGVNGYALPLEAQAQDYFLVIKELLDSPESMFLMSKSSREHYDSHLSWDNFGKRFTEVCNELLK